MGVLFDVSPVERALELLLGHRFPFADVSPTIRTTSSSTRASRVQALIALQDDYAATTDAVSRVEAQVAAIMLGLQQRKAEAANALALVAGLPVELLTEIFLIVKAKEHSSQSIVALSHVSSRWRSVALGTKELWTDVDNLAMLHAFASRSGALPLQLYTMSKVPYPRDVELNPEIASRLSTWAVTNTMSFSPRFSQSIETHASSMELGALILSGPRLPIQIYGGMLSAKLLLVTNTELFDEEVDMVNLTELSIAQVGVNQVSGMLDNIDDAPLSRITLSSIVTNPPALYFGGLVQPQGPQRIEPHGYDRCTKNLTMIDCHEDVSCDLLHYWEMEDLESLTLNAQWVRIPKGAHFLSSLRHLSTISQELQLLDIAVRVKDVAGISLILAENLFQQVHTLQLRASHQEMPPSDRECFLGALEARAGSSASVVSLKRLAVSSNFVRERDQTERYQAVAEVFEIDDDPWERDGQLYK